MNCWHCKRPLDISRPTFRETCPHCLASLHCCKQCRFYQPGKPNDCLVPGTEFIANREAFNLCEEYSAHSNPVSGSTTNAADIEKRLFGN